MSEREKHNNIFENKRRSTVLHHIGNLRMNVAVHNLSYKNIQAMISLQGMADHCLLGFSID